MPDHRKRFESMLFNYETTGRTDFRDGDIKPIITTKYQGKGTCLRVRPRPLKDINAMTDWRVPNVPFDLFGKAKVIVRTNPNDIQKPYGRVPDYEREIVQKNRPRLVMTPAASLDDIEDEPRKIIIDNMYTTTQMYTMRDALTNTDYLNVRPFTGSKAPANPISLSKLQPLYVSPEWRMDSVSWDNRQLRAYCNPTRRFWHSQTSSCEECVKTAARKAMKKMKQKH